MSDNLPNEQISKNKEGWAPHITRDSLITSQLNSVFELLRSSRRRYLLYYLNDSDETVVSLEELVEGVREYEAADSDVDELPPRQSVRISLIHTDIPVLASMGVLDHDIRCGEVRYYGYAPLENWLEQAASLEIG